MQNTQEQPEASRLVSGTPSTLSGSASGAETAASQAKKLAKFFSTLLLPGESNAQYNELRRQVFENLDPADTIETIWAKDITDAAFDCERMKRLKIQYIETVRRSCLKAEISKITAPDPLEKLSNAQVAERFVNEALQDPKGDARIRDKLSQAGLDPEALLAEAYGKKLDEIDKFERLIVNAERKRDRLIRQFHDFRERPRQRKTPVLDLEAGAAHDVSGRPKRAEH